MRRWSTLSRTLAAFVASVALVLGVAGAASATPVLVATIPAVDNPTNVVYSPDGSILYVMSENTKELQYFDTATNTPIATYTLSGITMNRITYVVISPDGSTLYAAGEPSILSNNSVVYVIDISTATPAVTNTISIQRGGSGLALTPDGSTLYAANHYSGTISVIDTGSGAVSATISVDSTTDPTKKLMSPWRIAVSPNGLYYFAAYASTDGASPGYSGYASFRVSDNALLDQTDFGIYPTSGREQPYGVAVTSDSQFLYVSSRVYGATANAWIKKVAINTDGTFGTVTTTANVPNTPAGLALSADDSRLYVTTYGTGKFMVYNTSTMSSPEVFTLTGMQHEIMIAPSLSPASHFTYLGAGGYLYSGGFSSYYLIGEYLGPYNQVLNETAGNAFASAPLTASGLSGTVAYSISPGLPGGLTFDSTTGVIAGTVTCALPTTVFTITGTDGTSSAVATVSLTVTGSDCGSALPDTGFDAWPAIFLGLATLTVGLGLVLVKRRAH